MTAYQAQTRTGPARTPVQTRTPGPAPTRAPQTLVAGQMCVVVAELAEGESAALVRNLRRRGSTQVVLLARSAGRRDLVGLLHGGLRGAVAVEPSGVIDVVPRQAAPLAEQRRPDRDLSERELGVLALVAEGNTNRSVGEHLGLSALTVKSHLSRISKKLGSGDRAELVAIAIRTGLMP